MARKWADNELCFVFQAAFFRFETLAALALDEDAEIGGGAGGCEVWGTSSRGSGSGNIKD